jgi:general stress protein CsbA
MLAKFKTVFQRSAKYDDVRPLNIYLLRLVYLLMFFVLGNTAWTHVLTHRGPWEPADAVAWCVWAAFATLAGLGIFRPLKMLPILLLEIFYKVLWLAVVAYPLWAADQLTGSSAEGTTSSFLWVVLPIVAVPWGYVFMTYVYTKAKRLGTEGEA